MMAKTGYLYEEHETHLYYIPCEGRWKAWTNMQEYANKFRKCGWTLTEVGKVDGEEVDWTFTMNQKSAITIRDMTLPPPKRGEVSEKSMEALRRIHEKRREANNVSSDV